MIIGFVADKHNTHQCYSNTTLRRRAAIQCSWWHTRESTHIYATFSNNERDVTTHCTDVPVVSSSRILAALRGHRQRASCALDRTWWLWWPPTTRSIHTHTYNAWGRAANNTQALLITSTRWSRSSFSASGPAFYIIAHTTREHTHTHTHTYTVATTTTSTYTYIHTNL